MKIVNAMCIGAMIVCIIIDILNIRDGKVIGGTIGLIICIIASLICGYNLFFS